MNLLAHLGALYIIVQLWIPWARWYYNHHKKGTP